MKKKNAFTLVEVVIVLSILSILSVIFVEIFFRSLRGANKAQIVGVVKQNGQVALETMDKLIRNSDKVVCINISGDTLVIRKGVTATRFKFNPPQVSPPANGYISQDGVGDCISPLFNASSLTNQNTTTGSSVSEGTFSLNSQPGYKNLVKINFQIGPAVKIPKTLTDTTQPIRFNTTVQLR